MTKEADIASHLQTLTRMDWKPLFTLLYDIEQATGPGTQIAQNGTSQFIDETALMEQRFHEVVYGLGIVFAFDWPNWQAGANALSSDQTDYNQFELVTLCRFITAIVRNDRFCEGYLISQFTNGTATKLLRALKYQVGVTLTD